MKKTVLSLAVAGIVFCGYVSAVHAAFVTVGNAGNAEDSTGYGAVAYEYQISQFEVTAGEYTLFLNAVAATDTNNLYSTNMNTGESVYGCNIIRTGDPGSYSYAVGPDWANRPVNYVSWYDAVRYANWLTTNNTETGVYDIDTTDPDPGNWTVTIMAHAAAAAAYGTAYFIPTEDEWYKAAYHKNDGVTGNYWDYPTTSDTAPGYVNDAGNLSGTGALFSDGVADPGNYATYDGDAGTDGIGSPYYRTIVGEWENSTSPYGTFDQGGNVWEWNEALISGSLRGVRGGSFYGNGTYLHAGGRSVFSPASENYGVGFRVASMTSIPEPGALALLVLGAAGMVGRRRRVAC
jgi:sulfatase modifying factor 1